MCLYNLKIENNRLLRDLFVIYQAMLIIIIGAETDILQKDQTVTCIPVYHTSTSPNKKNNETIAKKLQF